MGTKLQTQARRCNAIKGHRVIKANRQRRIQSIRRSFKPDLHDPKFMLGLGLYCGEGTKRKRVQFSNANPRLIKFMVQWFRRYLNCKEYCLRIQHYGCISDRAVAVWWNRHTGIPMKLMQVAIAPASSWSKKRKGNSLIHGTAHVRLYKSEVPRIKLTKARELAGVN